jgi:hypothetical protein
MIICLILTCSLAAGGNTTKQAKDAVVKAAKVEALKARVEEENRISRVKGLKEKTPTIKTTTVKTGANGKPIRVQESKPNPSQK